MDDYGGLGLQIKAHWKAHRPRLYRELEARGQLEASVSQAEEQTADALHDLVVLKSLPYDQAWELVREEWAFVPAEADDQGEVEPP